MSAVADPFDVLFRVIFVLRCPARNDLPYGVQLVALDVVPKHDECGPDAPFHFRKLFKGVVSRLTDLTLPVIPHPDVQWVVVPDSPRNPLTFDV